MEKLVAEPIKENVVNLINVILRDQKWSAARLAREVGVSPSTITRALNPETKFVLSARTISKLVEIVGKLRIEAIDDAMATHGSLLQALSALPKAPIQPIPIRGEIRAGAWVDHHLIRSKNYDFAFFHDPDWPNEVHAFKISGELTDRDYPEGTLVFCAPTKENSLVIGDIVVMRRRIDTVFDSKFETSLWDVSAEDNGAVFKSRSKSEGKPVDFRAPAVRDTIDYIGTVVGIYIVPPRHTGAPIKHQAADSSDDAS